ncbi:MAG: transposase [Methylococcaceae bacterium]|nr:transposase [Methylococcaceae bacterium]
MPRQRNSRDENAPIEEKHYGYKNHINADAATSLIQAYQVTPANVHDSQVFEDLLAT